MDGSYALTLAINLLNNSAKDHLNILSRDDIATIKRVIRQAKDILLEEPTVLYLSGDYHVIGDLHGELYSLLAIFHQKGFPSDPLHKYIFLGDYVDRGGNQLELFILLCLLKVLYPRNIILLRGNHETEQVSKEFLSVSNSFHSALPALCTALYDSLPLVAVVNNKFVCLHGGIPSSCIELRQLANLGRRAIPKEDVDDILWSDPTPEEDATFRPNKTRKKGHVFGLRALESFLNGNGLSEGYLIRGHQMPKENGYETFGNRGCTVYSGFGYGVHSGAVLSIVNGTTLTALSVNSDSGFLPEKHIRAFVEILEKQKHEDSILERIPAVEVSGLL